MGDSEEDIETKAVERLQSKIRAHVEHPFRVIKQLFGYRKVRYKVLAKKMNHLYMLFALSNRYFCRRHSKLICRIAPVMQKMLAGELVDGAIVEAEAAVVLKDEAEALIKIMRPSVALQRVYQHCLNCWRGKAACQSQAHHGAAVPLTELSGDANPNIQRAQIVRHFAPVPLLLERWVYYFDEADGFTVELGYQLFAPIELAAQLLLPLPVVVGVCGADVFLLIPRAQQGKVGARRWAQLDGHR